MRKSTLKPQIWKAAIPLFARQGCYGVTKDSLIEAAKVSKSSLNRLYTSMDRVLDDTLTYVILSLQGELSGALPTLQNDASPRAVDETVRRWYYALSQEAARFLQQVMMHDPKNRDRAYLPLKHLVDQLTVILQQQNPHKTAASHRSNAENLMWSLFHGKVIRRDPIPDTKESTTISRKIQCWIDTSM